MKSTFRACAAALALAGGLALAQAAHAATVLLDQGAMTSPRIVTIAGLGDVKAGPIIFKANWGGAGVDLVAWCVDVYHHITLANYAPDLQYTDGHTLSNDFSAAATPLDAGDVMKVGLLANYGQDVFDDLPVSPGAFTLVKPVRASYPLGTAGTNAYNAAYAEWNAAKAAHTAATNAYNAAVSLRFTRLAAVQSAIWQVMSNRNVTSKTADAAFDLLVDNLSSDNLGDFFLGYGPQGHAVDHIRPVQLYGGTRGTTPLALTQSFVIAQVPEPATWTMLIAGFGAVGWSLRRARRTAAATA